MLRKALYDPSFWIIVSVNVFCIYYYQKHPEGFRSIVWIYWIQSVLIGLFNFLDLLTVKYPVSSEPTINDNTVDSSGRGKGCTALFFLFHYQFFHFVYAIFIAIQVKGMLDIHFILLSVGAILVELTISFIRNKQWQKILPVNYGRLFLMPYLRIIPMHLMILLPAFFGIKTSIVFLVLKLLADAGMYLVAQRLYATPEKR